jgi:hypothetical protein
MRDKKEERDTEKEIIWRESEIEMKEEIVKQRN